MPVCNSALRKTNIMCKVVRSIYSQTYNAISGDLPQHSDNRISAIPFANIGE